MMLDYEARDTLGETHSGQVEADSRDDATRKLELEGFRVVSLKEVDETPLFPRGVKKGEIIYVTSQLSIMVDTGITLSAALTGVCDQMENPTLKGVLLDIRNQVEAGEDFSTALAKHPKHFDKTFVALMKAAEQTGGLGEMLERVSNYMRDQVENRAKIRAALAYPGVMLVLAIGVTTFLLTAVLPKFTPMFKKKGIKLPPPTVIIMTLSDALMNYWYLWILGIVALVLGFVFGKRTTQGRMILDGVMIRAPLFGPMFRKIILSRSISTLGTMLKSGVSVLEALKLCGEVSGNIWYERAWQKVIDDVTQGTRVAESLRSSSLFPKTLIQMIGSGEETGRLDYVLTKVSTYYDREVETSIKASTSLIEPIMITVMGTIVGGIGMGIMLPIFQLSKAQ